MGPKKTKVAVPSKPKANKKSKIPKSLKIIRSSSPESTGPVTDVDKPAAPSVAKSGPPAIDPKARLTILSRQLVTLLDIPSRPIFIVTDETTDIPIGMQTNDDGGLVPIAIFHTTADADGQLTWLELFETLRDITQHVSSDHNVERQVYRPPAIVVSAWREQLQAAACKVWGDDMVIKQSFVHAFARFTLELTETSPSPIKSTMTLRNFVFANLASEEDDIRRSAVTISPKLLADMGMNEKQLIDPAILQTAVDSLTKFMDSRLRWNWLFDKDEVAKIGRASGASGTTLERVISLARRLVFNNAKHVVAFERAFREWNKNNPVTTGRYAFLFCIAAGPTRLTSFDSTAAEREQVYAEMCAADDIFVQNRAIVHMKDGIPAFLGIKEDSTDADEVITSCDHAAHCRHHLALLLQVANKTPGVDNNTTNKPPTAKPDRSSEHSKFMSIMALIVVSVISADLAMVISRHESSQSRSTRGSSKAVGSLKVKSASKRDFKVSAMDRLEEISVRHDNSITIEGGTEDVGEWQEDKMLSYRKYMASETYVSRKVTTAKWSAGNTLAWATTLLFLQHPILLEAIGRAPTTPPIETLRKAIDDPKGLLDTFAINTTSSKPEEAVQRAVTQWLNNALPDEPLWKVFYEEQWVCACGAGKTHPQTLVSDGLPLDIPRETHSSDIGLADLMETFALDFTSTTLPLQFCNKCTGGYISRHIVAPMPQILVIHLRRSEGVNNGVSAAHRLSFPNCEYQLSGVIHRSTADPAIFKSVTLSDGEWTVYQEKDTAELYGKSPWGSDLLRNGQRSSVVTLIYDLVK